MNETELATFALALKKPSSDGTVAVDMVPLSLLSRLWYGISDLEAE